MRPSGKPFELILVASRPNVNLFIAQPYKSAFWAGVRGQARGPAPTNRLNRNERFMGRGQLSRIRFAVTATRILQP